MHIPLMKCKSDPDRQTAIPRQQIHLDEQAAGQRKPVVPPNHPGISLNQHKTTVDPVVPACTKSHQYKLNAVVGLHRPFPKLPHNSICASSI